MDVMFQQDTPERRDFSMFYMLPETPTDFSQSPSVDSLGSYRLG